MATIKVLIDWTQAWQRLTDGRAKAEATSRDRQAKRFATASTTPLPLVHKLLESFNFKSVTPLMNLGAGKRL